ncbi:hypothetical protein MCHI_001822 [Candidatus Magnetoovum chiemensis]|nr:hypothetical protein MCHI_001822 [Candidatus Magnetoovum chiemensis]
MFNGISIKRDIGVSLIRLKGCKSGWGVRRGYKVGMKYEECY